jgi:hypothetical protein
MSEPHEAGDVTGRPTLDQRAMELSRRAHEARAEYRRAAEDLVVILSQPLHELAISGTDRIAEGMLDSARIRWEAALSIAVQAVKTADRRRAEVEGENAATTKSTKSTKPEASQP